MIPYDITTNEKALVAVFKGRRIREPQDKDWIFYEDGWFRDHIASFLDTPNVLRRLANKAEWCVAYKQISFLAALREIHISDQILMRRIWPAGHALRYRNGLYEKTEDCVSWLAVEEEDVLLLASLAETSWYVCTEAKIRDMMEDACNGAS